MKFIPCCNFHTNLLLLDDDEEFLKGIQYGLSNHHKCIFTTEINKAKEIIKKNENWVKELFKDGISRAFDNESSKFAIEMDISSLHKAVYQPKRFDYIAILIVDYDMPDMNGLDFIKSLGDHQLKIIMLTGKATQDTVIEAFNKGKIQRYVSKGGENYFETILEYVEELQNSFFMDFSKFILNSIKTETEIFENQTFQKLFNEIVQENNIVEYYLLDESGSFLMLNATAENQIWLIVKSKNDMRLFYELALDDPETPTYIIKKLKNCDAFTHFKTKKESYLDAKYWNLIDCKPLDEKKEFYYAVLKNDDDFKIDRSKIKSYTDSLNESE